MSHDLTHEDCKLLAAFIKTEKERALLLKLLRKKISSSKSLLLWSLVDWFNFTSSCSFFEIENALTKMGKFVLIEKMCELRGLSPY